MLLSPKLLPVVFWFGCVDLVNTYMGGQLHCCPLEASVCMAVHGPIPVIPMNCSSVHTLTSVPQRFIRSRGGDGCHPTIRREEEFDEDRLSGEYYSGEEFYEDDSMLSGDRYFFLIFTQQSYVLLYPVLLTNIFLVAFARNLKSYICYSVPTGIRTVTQSMRLPKVTITLTVTTTTMSSLSTATQGGHQRDGCFLPHLKVSPVLTYSMNYMFSVNALYVHITFNIVCLSYIINGLKALK